MTYEKQHFSAGQVLTAQHMNHIEDGIGQLSEEIGVIQESIGTKKIEWAEVREVTEG